MSRNRYSTSAAIVALVAALGGTALAQTAEAPAAGAPAAQSAEGLPAFLDGIDLRNVRTEDKRQGQREIEGRLPGGGKLELRLDRDGNLIEAEADDVAMPQQIVDAIVPEALRNHEAMALFARVKEVKLRQDGIEIDGYQENGDDLELLFDGDGRLIAIDADDTGIPQSLIDAVLPQAVRGSEAVAQFAVIDEIKSHDGGFRIEGEDADREDIRVTVDQDGRLLRFGRDGDDDKRQDKDKGEDRGGAYRGEGPRGEGPMGAGHGARGHGMMPRAAQPQFDPVELNQRLIEAGYSSFGFLSQRGPRIVLEAVNPAGEAVLLELNPAGEVVRETAR